MWLSLGRFWQTRACLTRFCSMSCIEVNENLTYVLVSDARSQTDGLLGCLFWTRHSGSAGTLKYTLLFLLTAHYSLLEHFMSIREFILWSSGNPDWSICILRTIVWESLLYITSVYRLADNTKQNALPGRRPVWGNCCCLFEGRTELSGA